eukprot:CAMPEP_0113528722 /NCGR_PEP_ID=MMETSP0015_2-20120614/2000_1 /TAXON_ID=2838 /ORGANISM="Odontella" /LENGTH=70 /DNA_ID=CAMNT_0000427281 /DNA_START=307 /DNA_END=519 /DNA_ORIENTATION=- /assembly_acc=CAM_ASM_000160
MRHFDTPFVFSFPPQSAEGADEIRARGTGSKGEPDAERSRRGERLDGNKSCPRGAAAGPDGEKAEWTNRG